MFFVRFVRKDEHPDEFYAYSTKVAAKNHFDMFLDDDSNIFSRVELIQSDNEVESTLETIIPTPLSIVLPSSFLILPICHDLVIMMLYKEDGGAINESGQ